MKCGSNAEEPDDVMVGGAEERLEGCRGEEGGGMTEEISDEGRCWAGLQRSSVLKRTGLSRWQQCMGRGGNSITN